MDGSLASPASAGFALDRYKRLFEEARDRSENTRQRAFRARRYYDGKYDQALEKELKAKKQPTAYANRVKLAIEGMVGVVDRGKSDPRAYPRTPQDENSSEVATDTLRYIADVNRWHPMKLASFRTMLVEGVAAVLTEVDDDLEVRFRKIRYEEFFADPYSRELDYSDASYMGLAKWQYQDALIAAYPEYRGAILEAIESGDVGDSAWSDRPNATTTWTDRGRKRMLVVEMYHLQGGVWTKCVFAGSLKLEEGVSPYLDSKGRPCNPIEAAAAYVDDENERYGAVHDMQGPQDEINTLRRRAMFRGAFRQVQETDPVSAYADPEEVRREAARPDGVIPPGYGLVPDDKFAVDMALLQQAYGDIERSGAAPEILGRQGATQSGRAQLIRQQAGMTELSHLFTRLEDWELRIYRQAWARVRQYWTEPKFLRVTDDEKAFRFIQINEPIWSEPVPVVDPVTGFPKFDPITRQVVMQPQFMGMRNAVAQMDVDIIIDSTPDTANVQAEQFQALAELAQAGAFNPGNPAGPLLIRASSMPKKRELLEMLDKSAQPQQAAAPDPRQEAAVELAMREKAAGIGKTEAQTAEAQARALKTMREAGAYDMQSQWLERPPGF